ncbi:MAG TPA: hypothetical protein VG734_25130, partial [Lacunisphaera sp.]|nr:hypothetical protein [Lacunisphaera sp.]
LRLPEPHHFAAGFPLALLGETERALALFADAPQWMVDLIFLLEQETGCLGGNAGFERLLQRLNALEAWQSLQRVGAERPAGRSAGEIIMPA